MNTKNTNPKDAIGICKVPASCIPRAVLAEVALGMMEGALKYGRHNYRVKGVRASVYFDAANRHLDAWWEGQDIDPASGLHHITKAITSLVVLRDAMLNGKCNDDRPPSMLDADWQERLNAAAAQLIDQYPNPVPAFTIMFSSRQQEPRPNIDWDQVLGEVISIAIEEAEEAGEAEEAEVEMGPPSTLPSQR